MDNIEEREAAFEQWFENLLEGMNDIKDEYSRNILTKEARASKNTMQLAFNGGWDAHHKE